VKYAVHWSHAALNSLAEIWLALEPTARPRLNEVVADVERLLQFEPAEQGESRDEGRRVFFAPPLVVTFRVLQPQRIVQIVFVRLMKSGSER
jgi:hypothetical protein